MKNRVEAESPVLREKAWNVFRSDLYSRLQRGGRDNAVEPSIGVIQTRWHVDDLAGRLTKGDEDEDFAPWHTINIPAIANEGTGEERALWAALVPLKRLQKIRRTVGPYAWSSLYQGQPRPRGGTVFETPSVWTQLPKVFRVARCLDLAYTTKTLSDFSVLVDALVAPGFDRHGHPCECFYVVNVLRKQQRAPDFQAALRRHVGARWSHAPIGRYGASGPEAGAVDMLRAGPDGVKQLVRVQAVGDKYVRAQPYAAAWNAGRVLVPEDSRAFPWVDEFVAEHMDFTGLKDAHDDQVDAGAAMHDSAARSIDDKQVRSLPRKPLPKPGLAGVAM